MSRSKRVRFSRRTLDRYDKNYPNGHLSDSYINSLIKRLNQKVAYANKKGNYGFANAIVEQWRGVTANVPIKDKDGNIVRTEVWRFELAQTSTATHRGKAKGNWKIRQNKHNREVIRYMTEDINQLQNVTDINEADEFIDYTIKGVDMRQLFQELEDEFFIWLYNMSKNFGGEYRNDFIIYKKARGNGNIDLMYSYFVKYYDEFIGTTKDIEYKGAPPEASDTNKRKNNRIPKNM